MDVVPVIDLKSGQVVHARQGARDRYRPIATPLAPSSGPRDVVAGLLGVYPFARLYVADLDAIAGTGEHGGALADITEAWPGLELWVDPGIGDEGAARAWLGRTPANLVIGSESQHDSAVVRALAGHPRMLLSLDFRDETFQGPSELLRDAALWPARVIVMTLARVGGGAGPDLARMAEIVRQAGARAVYAAGGVRDAADLHALAQAGAAGVLVATALHSGAIGASDLAALAVTPASAP